MFDTLNKFMVAKQGELTVVMNPPRAPLTKAEALNLAAYLVALNDSLGHDFPPVLKAIREA